MCLAQAFRSQLGAKWSTTMAEALHWALEITTAAMIEGVNDHQASNSEGSVYAAPSSGSGGGPAPAVVPANLAESGPAVTTVTALAPA